MNAVSIAGSRYGRDYCPQLAASISYHVLFSFLPFVIFLVSLLGLVMQNDEAREAVVSWMLSTLPLTESAGEQLDDAVAGLATPVSAVGLIGLVGFLWSASRMMGSVRIALDLIWKAPHRRAYGHAKLVDLALVLAAGALVLVAFALTFVTRVVTGLSEEAASVLEPLSRVVSAAGALTEVLTGVAVAFGAFVLLYRFVPPVRPRWVHACIGAGLAAVALEIGTFGYSVYLAYFADYNVVYGSLGAAVGFLFLVFIAASIFLFGAEIAAAWPQAGEPRARPQEGGGLRQRLWRLLRSLFVRSPQQSASGVLSREEGGGRGDEDEAARRSRG